MAEVAGIEEMRVRVVVRVGVIIRLRLSFVSVLVSFRFEVSQPIEDSSGMTWFGSSYV